MITTKNLRTGNWFSIEIQTPQFRLFKKKLMDFFSQEEVEITLSSFSTAVWSKSWEENFDHFQTKDYLFSPPGKSHSVSTSKKILYIDPGAFGTGEHITTKLCLLMLEKISLTLTYKNSFLDIGTGSGILAAWAESEGFKDILATDICEDAIRSAKRTKELNRHSFEIKNQTLPATFKIFDIIVCNILPLNSTVFSLQSKILWMKNLSLLSLVLMSQISLK